MIILQASETPIVPRAQNCIIIPQEDTLPALPEALEMERRVEERGTEGQREEGK